MRQEGLIKTIAFILGLHSLLLLVTLAIARYTCITLEQTKLYNASALQKVELLARSCVESVPSVADKPPQNSRRAKKKIGPRGVLAEREFYYAP